MPGDSVASPQCRCAADSVDEERYPRRKTPARLRSIASVALGFLVAFFPKCAVCWAAYLSVFGILGAAGIPYLGWLYPLLAALLGVQLLLALRRAPQTGYGPFALGMGGALTVLAGRHYLPFAGWILIAGILLIAAGSLWDSLSVNRMHSPLQH